MALDVPIYSAPYQQYHENTATKLFDRHPDGQLWLLAWDGGNGSTSNQMQLYFSNDDGETWSQGGNTALGFAGSGATYLPRVSMAMFIDAGGNMHIVYIDPHDGNLKHVRGFRTASEDGYIFGVARVVSLRTDTNPHTPDLVVETNSISFWIHIVWSGEGTYGTADTQTAYYRRLRYDNNDTYTWETTATRIGFATYGMTAPVSPSIDFYHTATGKDRKSSTPHLFVAWTTNASGIRYRRAVYSSGPTWTWQTEVAGHTVGGDYQNVNVVYNHYADRVFIAAYRAYSVFYVYSMASTSDTPSNHSVPGVIGAAYTSYSLGLSASTLDGDMFLTAKFETSTAGYIRQIRWAHSSGGVGTWQSWKDVKVGWEPFWISSPRLAKSSYTAEFIYQTQATPAVYSFVVPNTLPSAPTLTYPINGQAVNKDAQTPWTWTPNDPDGDAQVNAELRYKVSGDPSYTNVLSLGSATQWTPPVLGEGVDYLWGVRTADAEGFGPWSADQFFWATTPPPDPVITYPSDGGTITAYSYNINWTATQQSEYRVIVINTTTQVVLFNSGWVADSAARSTAVTGFLQGESYSISVQVRYNGLESGTDINTATVVYTPPPQPSVTIYSNDYAGLGIKTSYQLHVVADSPAYPQMDLTQGISVYARRVGETHNGALVASMAAVGYPDSSTGYWHSPVSDVDYEFQFRYRGVNESYGETPWYKPTNYPYDRIRIRGFVLHDPAAPANAVWIQLNNTGAKEIKVSEHEFMRYDGRDLPAVEFGSGLDWKVEVPLVFSEDGTTAYQLRDLVDDNKVLCYRDSKGRKVYGIAEQGSIDDRSYGETTSLVFVAVDTPWREEI